MPRQVHPVRMANPDRLVGMEEMASKGILLCLLAVVMMRPVPAVAVAQDLEQGELTLLLLAVLPAVAATAATGE